MADSANLLTGDRVSILLLLLSTMIEHTFSYWILHEISFISMILSDELYGQSTSFILTILNSRLSEKYYVF